MTTPIKVEQDPLETLRQMARENPDSFALTNADALEIAEAIHIAAEAKTREEDAKVFDEGLVEQAARLSVHHSPTESPGNWRDRVRRAAIRSRMEPLNSIGADREN